METVKKSLFLTGATGYVGSAILKHYLKNSWEVTAYLRNSNSPKTEQLRDIGAKIIIGNLDEFEKISKASENHDVIIHAAIDLSNVENNMETTKIFLESAKKTAKIKDAMFIYCSGALAYGSHKEVLDETAPIKSQFPNSWVIDINNLILSEIRKTNNLSLSIIRPGWVYGLNNGNYISDYLRYCRGKKYVPVPKDLTNYLSFIHVNDNANCFYLVGSKRLEGVFNAVDNNCITIDDFCDGVAKFLKVETKKNHDYKGLFYTLGFGTSLRIITKRREETAWKLDYPSFLGCIEKTFSEL